MLKLHKETETCSSKPLLEPECYFLPPSPSPVTLHNSLTNSDYTFFIRYIPEYTLKPYWFFVQTNHTETTLLDSYSQNTGDYHVTFIFRRLDYNHSCYDTTRWWPL